MEIDPLILNTYPKKPVRLYKKAGRRDKARAFLEWWGDHNSDSIQAQRFYANEWGISVSTANAWIKEFDGHRHELLSFQL